MKKFEDYKKLVQKQLLPKLEKIEGEITSLKEEWEIMKNPKLVRKIEEALEQKKKGKIYSWKEFKKIVDGK